MTNKIKGGGLPLATTACGVFRYPLLFALLFLTSCDNQKQNYLQGTFEAHRVWVSSKIPGRLQTVNVEAGDSVFAEQELAILSSPEIDAKKEQAQGALKAAESQNAKAKAGARKEEISALHSLYIRAQESADLSKATYERVKELYEGGVLPLQKRDEAFTAMTTSQANADAAKQQYEIAATGAREEDKAAAAALVLQAKGAWDEVNSYLKETVLRSPINGEIASKNAEQGELIGPGMPVFSVIDRSQSWAVFNIREDYIGDFSKGTVIRVWIPALKQSADLKIYHIAPLGDFATWRSSKETGGFDLKTFEIKAHPVTAIPDLRPGMSALLPVRQL